MTKHKMGMWLCSNCNISVLSGDAHFCNYNMGERKMKQFDPSKPYQTRSGLKVGELHKYKIKYKDVVLEKFYSTIYFDTDHEVIHTWLLDGKSDSDHRNSENDLVNIPEKHEVTVYFRRNNIRIGEMLAINYLGEGVIAKKIVTFEEGEGLEEAK